MKKPGQQDENSPLRFLMVCEGELDFHTASNLADRVICEGVDWIPDREWHDAEVIDSFRQWKGIDTEHKYLKWSSISKLPNTRMGKFSGETGDMDSFSVRKVLQFARYMSPVPSAIFIVRDADRYDESRRRGISQAVIEALEHLDRPIVVGFAIPKREAWVLCGFTCQDASEERLLKDCRQALKFDPITNCHELDATGTHDKHTGTKHRKSAKIVLDSLVPFEGGQRFDRESQCWRSTPLNALRTNGVHNGLRDYLDAVECRIVPLFK